MKLSILITTTCERMDSFIKLYAHIAKQLTREVEIIALADDKQLSVGKKRQRLLEMAAGDYLVFIDDDDWVPDFYVHKILEATNRLPDCIGFLIDCAMNGKDKSAIASLKYEQWEDNKDEYDYVRGIYHKTPVRREFAVQTGFNDLRYGEDYDYAVRLQPLLKTEVFIPETMYFYRYSSSVPHLTKYGINGK